jgi:hypothetical protein
MRKTVNRLLTGTLDDDTFPAFYRANTANDLLRTARGVGMSPVWVRYVSHHPTYLLFSTMIYRLGVVFEQVIRRCDALRGIRHMIQAVFEVPALPIDTARRAETPRVAQPSNAPLGVEPSPTPATLPQ